MKARGVEGGLKKLVTRSFRVTEESDRALVAEAEKQGISVGTLMGKILDRYMKISRFSDDFGELKSNSKTIKAIIDCIGEDKLSELGRSLGKSVPEFALTVVGHPCDWDGCLFFFEKFLGEYARWYEASVREQKAATTLVMFDKYRMGKKWLVFVSNYVSAMFEAVLSTKLEPEIRLDYALVRIPNVNHPNLSSKQPRKVD